MSLPDSIAISRLPLEDIVMVAGTRLPIGRFGGSLKDLPVYDLGALAIAEAVRRSGLEAETIDEVFVAHNRQSGNGPNPGRTAAVRGGIPTSVPAHTINMACPAGLRATIEAAQAIMLGECESAVVCGMESMSTIPHILTGARWKPVRTGNLVVQDEFFGMTEPLSGMNTIELAEHTARKFSLSREEQEQFALESHHKAARAWEEGWFDEEVLPVEIEDARGEPTVFSRDECFRADTTLEKMAKLKPAQEGGSVTAAMASGVTDGAGAFVLTSREKAAAAGLSPLSSLVSYAQIGLDPADMLEGPAFAIPMVLEKAGLTLGDIDLIEVNEAFASQILANELELGWDRSRLNIHGGAIALGHPTGFTGVRLMVSLSYALRTHGGTYGLIAICGGGGLGVAMIIRNESANPND
ncbi:MAG: thiolase family protein [Pseudomonadales bacterium]|nr:thiolase family protein [Pseudomonadales bacterium]MDP7313437.1 thiolase family protein [Pseudomonadales bacterium]